MQLPAKATMADGIAVGKPGAIPFAVLTDPAHGLDDLRTVTEEQLSEALLSMLERAKMVVEPAGAASVAAVLADPPRSRRRWWWCCRGEHRSAAVAAGDPARPGLGRALPVADRAVPGPARLARHARDLYRRQRCERAGGACTGARRRVSPSTTSRCRWISRPAGPSTPGRCSTASGGRDTPSGRTGTHRRGGLAPQRWRRNIRDDPEMCKQDLPEHKFRWHKSKVACIVGA